MIRTVLLFSLCLFQISIFSQETIFLENSSFEDVPGFGITPEGWYNCGGDKHSPPDIHPSFGEPIFGVKTPPYDGETYVGLIVRDDNTWESIGQRLSAPLQGEQCYVFNLFLARSFQYESISPTSKEFDFFREPVIVTLWGGYEECGRTEMLAKSAPINSLEWSDYQFFFKPSKTYTHLIIEAYYGGSGGKAYNGNVLIDYASPIIAADCNSGQERFTPPKSKNTNTQKKKQSERIPLSSLEQLEELIKLNTPEVAFDTSANTLTKKSIIALTEIGRAKLDFGRYRLVIAINSNDFDQKIVEGSLKQVFKDGGVPETSYRIVEMNKTDQNSWIAETNQFKIGLVDRLKKK